MSSKPKSKKKTLQQRKKRNLALRNFIALNNRDGAVTLQLLKAHNKGVTTNITVGDKTFTATPLMMVDGKLVKAPTLKDGSSKPEKE